MEAVLACLRGPKPRCENRLFRWDRSINWRLRVFAGPKPRCENRMFEPAPYFRRFSL